MDGGIDERMAGGMKRKRRGKEEGNEGGQEQ